MQKGFGASTSAKTSVEIKPFKPRNFGEGGAPVEYQQVKAQFGSLADTDSGSNQHFQLHPTSKRLLGVEQEELSHIEDRVRAEVQARTNVAQDEGYKAGFEAGHAEGMQKAEEDARARFNPMIQQLGQTMQAFDSVKEELFQANERVLVQLVFNVAKQVLLRELKADPEYVKRLCAAVIDKIGAKDSVKVRLNREDFANVEQIRDFIKSQFPDLKNIQIDPTDDLESGGCKVETDLSRINAAVGIQLEAIESSLNKA